MKVKHIKDDVFDILGGKGMQAAVHLSDDGDYDVIGPPTCGSKNAVSASTLDNVRYVLSRTAAETLGKWARLAKESRGGIRV